MYHSWRVWIFSILFLIQSVHCDTMPCQLTHGRCWNLTFDKGRVMFQQIRKWIHARTDGLVSKSALQKYHTLRRKLVTHLVWTRNLGIPKLATLIRLPKAMVPVEGYRSLKDDFHLLARYVGCLRRGLHSWICLYATAWHIQVLIERDIY